MDILDNTCFISCYIHRKKKENKKHNKEDACLSELWIHLESIIKIKHLHYVGVFFAWKEESMTVEEIKIIVAARVEEPLNYIWKINLNKSLKTIDG